MEDLNSIINGIIPYLKFRFPYSIDEYIENLYFENYHCHKDFSNVLIADSGEPIENYASRTIELGGKCLFSGEHGSQGNQFHVYNVAEKNKLRYRHSTEAYWVKDRLAEIQTGTDKNGNPTYAKDRTNCHMILVAKNAEGRRDINFALSMANIDGYYYRPRIDLKLLFDIPKENVIVTSACIAGWLYEDASEIWLKIHEHFGDNFYFELQANNTEEQKRINEKILRLSEKCGIEIIAGLDSHYIGEPGRIKRDQILKYKNVSYPEEEGWYMDYPDGFTLYKRFEEQGILNKEQILRSIMNTNVFVNECEEIVFDRSFKIPSIYKDKTYDEKVQIFKNVLNEAYKKEKIKSKEKAEGIRYEAEQIIDSGVVDYFLTSQAIIKDAVENEGGILTTTARGSASSFIINKLLGLTTVDRFNTDVPLIPERFLTKERVMAGMMPDEDINLGSQEPFVIATKKIVGEEGCYPLMAVEKLKVKAAWQLYAGVNDVSPSDANQISKYIDEYEKKLKHADEDEKEDIKIEDFIPNEYIELYNKSNEYRGITINLKVHACFTRGQLVLTENGYKEIQDVEIGEYVLTHNNTYQQVLDTQELKSDDIYSIKITGDLIEATSNHPFYVRTRGYNCEKGSLSEPYWKNASCLTKEDWIGSPINNKSEIPTYINNNKTYKKHYLDLNDSKLWWLIGRYIGDGWTESPTRNGKELHRVVICCSKVTTLELNEIKAMIPDYLHFNISEYRTSYKFTTENKVLFEYLQQFGKYAYGKHLTNDIINLPIDKLRMFLIGYLSADGSVKLNTNKDGVYFTYNTVSKDLAYGLQQCIHKVFRSPCTITSTPAGKDIIEGRIVNRRKKYHGRFNIDYDSVKNKRNYYIDGMIWFKVKDVEKLNKSAEVYNLSVANSNSYTINNFAVHNCGHLLLDGDIRREIGLISATSKTTGKRTLCACVEGKVLDDFGFVKEDYLIVDTVSLTHECFQTIGKCVPPFDELREMVKNDNKTWDIYSRGITCCVNQCEKEATIVKLKKYKPKSVAELCAFIAAIRPGFAPLLNTFLNREEYSTGEREIDKLLYDTSKTTFILYQESLMVILNFLGLKMGDTYKVIKNISKKKYREHPEELKKLKEGLIKSWKDKIGNINNFEKVWDVIESSSLYAFNASHSLCVCFDSLYQAWFKAHYTKTFYEVAIRHYQQKGKKDKIDALVKEAMKFYGYKMGDYRFGDDNRQVSIDENTHIIYPNMSSLKGFGEAIGETLYDLKDNTYESFIDLYVDMISNGINKTIIDKLISINYFCKFGSPVKLKKEIEYYNLFYNMKTIRKDKAESLGLSFDLLKKYGNETEKQFNKINGPELFKEFCSTIKDRELTPHEIVLNEYNVYGMPKSSFNEINNRHFIVVGLESKKTITNISLYSIHSGKITDLKMWTNEFNRNSFKEGNFIFVISYKKQNKREPTDMINKKTGKKIYRDIPDQYEFWLNDYDILTEADYLNNEEELTHEVD